MFMRTSSSTRNGKTYTTAQVVEGYRTPDGKVRQKILFNLGSVEKLLKRDIDNLINGLLRLKGETTPVEGGSILSSQQFGHIWAAMMIFKELKITQALREAARKTKTEFDLIKHIQVMVLNRLDDPQSKLGLLSWCEEVYLPSIDRKNIKYPHLLRAMDFLIKHKRLIEDEIAARFLTIFDTELKLCFYDLTSSYFESEREVEGDIRKKGYSRDRRFDCKQIVIGVVMNQDGIPLCHYTFEGNTSDRGTVIGVVDDIKNRFGVRKVTLVADKGMTSKANYGWLNDAGVGFIFGESKRIRKTVREGLVKAQAGRRQLSAEKQKNLFYHEEPGFVNVRLSTKAKPSQTRLPVRHIYCYNPEIAHKQKERRERSLSGLLTLASELKTSDRTSQECYHLLREYLKKHKLSRLVEIPKDTFADKLRLNKEELKFEQQADGWFVVSTDTKAEDGFTTEEVVAQYKRLQMVENGFNTLKSTLDIRPMFHWTPDRIRAHVFICFLALQLTVFFNLRLKKTKISFEKAFSKLRRINVVTWQKGHSHHQALVVPNDEQLEIFKALKTPKPSMKSLVVSDF
jgi:transposase